MSQHVTIPSLDKSFGIDADESILRALLRQGLTPAYECGNGTCKTCRSQLLEGEVHYPVNPPLALTEADKESGLILICQARALGDVVVQPRLKVSLREQMRQHEIQSATNHLQIRKIGVTVSALEQLCHDVMLLRLDPDEPLVYLAGQYVNILTPFGTRRDFSITNAPGTCRGLEFHIRRVPDGEFTGYVFSGLEVGQRLEIEGPLGTFFLRENSERPMLLMAGGTGFGPIKGILERFFAYGGRVPVHLYWGARARRDLYLHELALEWERTHELFRYTPVLSEPQGDSQQEPMRTGFVHEALAADYPDLSDYDVYACGPPVMIKSAIDIFTQQALRSDRLFYDSFEFAPDHRGTATVKDLSQAQA